MAGSATHAARAAINKVRENNIAEAEPLLRSMRNNGRIPRLFR